jgi:hypothetical protein
MDAQVEKTINNINFTMTMENMPLTEQDKQRLRDCITGKADIEMLLRQTIAKHTQVSNDATTRI